MKRYWVLAAAGIVIGLAGPALADFRGDRHEVFRDPHSHGRRCAYRLAAYGEGSTDFYRGGSGVRKAEVRAIRHWEDKARIEFGERFARWDRAVAKDLRCRPEGPRIVCQAVAVACASRGEWVDRGPPGPPLPPGPPPGPPPRRY